MEVVAQADPIRKSCSSFANLRYARLRMMDSEQSCMHQGEMTKWEPLLVTILVVPGDQTSKAENGTKRSITAIHPRDEGCDGKTKKGSESENFAVEHED